MKTHTHEELEAIHKSGQRFVDILENDAEWQQKLAKNDAIPLTEEEDRVLEEFLMSGPAAWDFMTKFIQSDFAKEQIRR